MKKEKILVVEDEKEISDLIEIYLVNDGYEVLKAYNGEEALNILKNERVHLIVLDIMMPGMDGLEVCRRVRENNNIPILMLSAKSEDMDKILGLTTGADDYLTKPFNPLELLARVKSQLRRYIYLNPNSEINDDNDINIKGLTINKKTHEVTVYGRKVDLTPIEFDILALLSQNPGRVFSGEEIFKEIWKEKYFEGNNTVMVHIRKIREKIEDNPRQPQFIKTVWGVGYKIEN
ncbi:MULTISPECIES: response regulator transcription factor [Tissierellales]|jgi:DNA-binding response OmpR family regulator|uniref:Response regulator transcription factor n=1 Tax=Acidilutibacter cellobiosedens TaxID=2507161 RepID=A0A410QB39_9FIRM|nr:MULTISPECIES: response regulator transcription factor [Tissierellales]MBE6082506.1 response regulator transcription factor [Tissierellaceae bacterium]QAT61177.1 response regulator transcription factor [Acidilutibacter cellobiosedens]SCL93732.1 Transcriptional regulatory protein WalR [Sporanaerobacter sp. PP17-6a]